MSWKALKSTSMKLARVVLAGAIFMGGSASSVMAAALVLKFAHEAPATHIKNLSALKFAELVDKYSNGTIKVEVFPGAQLMPTLEEIRAAVRGQVDFIAPYTTYYSGIDGLWDIFYQPMLFKSPQQAMEIFAGEIGQSILARLDTRGLKGIAIWHDGPVNMFTRGEAALTPAAIKGMKVRTAPSKPLEALLQKSGAAPIGMPGPEVYLALQQNVVSGVVTTPTFAAPSRWGEVLTTMTREVWGIGGYGVAVSKRTWDKLSPEQQAIIPKAMNEATEWNRAQTLENIAKSEAMLVAGGLKIVELDDAQRTEWLELAKTVWATQSDEVKALIAKIQQK